VRNKKANILFSIIDEVLRLQNCFEDLFDDIRSLSHLTTLQKLVLFAALDSPAPLTVPQLGRNVGHSRQVVQRIVNELEKDGLLEKAENPHHRRALLLVPTAKANKLRMLAEKRAIESAAAFLGTVNAERCDALTAELRNFRIALEDYTQTDSRATASSQTEAISSARAFF
jgi:DNA-binding MarR family transcriptional regulator